MERQTLRVGLIGYGAIGQDISRLLAQRAVTDMTLAGALVHDPSKPRPADSPKIVTSCSALLAEHPDVVVEVAGHAGLREHGPGVLRAGIDLIFVSVGALAEPEMLQDMVDALQQGDARATIASGAIGGLDALSAASLGELTHVTHTMRRPPASLLSPEESARCTQEREIFRGSARQAVVQFPEFLNIAAAVALAGKGFDETEVRVLADPTIGYSLHEVQAEGEFGSLRLSIENKPIPSHGRGARLVAMSIIHTLLMRSASLRVG